ncbi:MAG: DUF2971 domain-containing protein [Methylococcales bacterium]
MRWSSPVVFNDIEECQFVPFTKDRISSAYKKYQEILTECAKGNLTPNYDSYSDVTKLIVSLLQITTGNDKFSAENLAEMMKKVSGSLEDDHRNFVNVALIKCFRVLCVTTEFDNNLMWAHYADQHHGCVLEFEEFFNNEPPGLRKGFVRYHENLEPTSNLLDNLLYGDTKEVTELLIKDVVFSKRTSWNYEKEYRFLFSESFGEITAKIDMVTNNRTISVKNQPETLYTDVAFSIGAIKSITFGARATKSDIEQIFDILTNKSCVCSLYQMQMRDGRMIRTDLVP